MSATTTQMSDAVAAIESALVTLGAAYASYESGRRQAKGDRFNALGAARGEELDNVVSTAQLNGVIAGRMCALGMASVLPHGLPGVGTQPPSWVTAWQAKVVAWVP